MAITGTLEAAISLLLSHLRRYVSRKYYESNPELKKAIDQIHDGFFSPTDLTLFHDLTYQLLNFDRYIIPVTLS